MRRLAAWMGGLLFVAWFAHQALVAFDHPSTWPVSATEQREALTDR